MKYSDFCASDKIKHITADPVPKPVQKQAVAEHAETYMEHPSARKEIAASGSGSVIKQTAVYPVRAQTVISPENMDLANLQNNLSSALKIIEDEVNKGYVTKLEQLPVIPPERVIPKDLQDIHFFKISELVYQENEFSVDNLSMVFSSLSNRPCTLVLMLNSNGVNTDFYLGARPNGNNSGGTLFQMLRQSLLGFFPGSKLTQYYDDDMRSDVDAIKVGAVSSVSCIADYKRNEKTVSNRDFVQGLEKFVYSMQGKSFTAIFIADSVNHDKLMEREHEYERIYSQISPFADMPLNFSVTNSSGSSTGESKGTTKNRGLSSTKGNSLTNTFGIHEEIGLHEETGYHEDTGYTDTESHSDSRQESESDGTQHTDSDSDSETETSSFGFSLFANCSFSNSKSHAHSVSDSVSKTLTYGTSVSDGRSHAKNRSSGVSNGGGSSWTGGTNNSVTSGTNEAITNSEGSSENFTNTRTLTDTFGNSRGITLHAKNMAIQHTMHLLEKHLNRIEECESYGMWNFAAYFLGESVAETVSAASTYKSVIAGTDSGIERSAVNSWSDEEKVRDLRKYIVNFIHPQFEYKCFGYGSDSISVNPSILVSTSELAIHMGLPRHSVTGLPVVDHARFALEIISNKDSDAGKLPLGRLYNLGETTEKKVELDTASLSMHTFVTGSTGSGKSNTVYQMLSGLRRSGVPFLVIEPAKGEYKDVFGGRKDVRVYGTNPNLTGWEMLRINPFSFPKHTHILEHLDRLIEIFNVCWPMYAAMPAVLKDAVESAYASCGWDLEKSVNKYDDRLFPSFRDVVTQVGRVMSESAYSADSKGDYTGSLVTRLKSLTNGINGLIFTTDDIPEPVMFDSSSIVDLSRVGSAETKSLIMGLLVLKLQEYRMEQRYSGEEANKVLKHVTVLEEAHNLLKRTSASQSGDTGNLAGKSVEMLSNSIAEMRTYGEGFIIADQAPGLLDMSAIRNTNTKIILRLPDLSDRELVGRAAGLDDHQIAELAKLETGVAAVSQNDWLEPVLCRVDEFRGAKSSGSLISKTDDDHHQRNDGAQLSYEIQDFIMNEGLYGRRDMETLNLLKDRIIRSKLGTSVKCALIAYAAADERSAKAWFRKLCYEFFNADSAIKASCQGTDIKSWARCVAARLRPDVSKYSAEKQKILMARIVSEMYERNPAYINVMRRFAEICQSEGGIF
jgi:DNA helicase HerA-like ATPase